MAVPEAPDGSIDSLFKGDPRFETDHLSGSGHIKETNWLAIRPGGVPGCRAIEPDRIHNRFRKLSDPGLYTGADVEGFRSFGTLGREHDRSGRVTNVEKLAGR
jgi:hypothetical protein